MNTFTTIEEYLANENNLKLSCKIKVDYELSPKQMTYLKDEKGDSLFGFGYRLEKYYTGGDVKEIQTKEVMVMSFSEKTVSEIIQEMNFQQYRPANIKELIMFGATYPDFISSKHKVVGLGSSHSKFGYTYFPYLVPGDFNKPDCSEVMLICGSGYKTTGYYFLAIKKE